MSDGELLKAYARHGSQTAFTQLVERHIDLVYAAALRRVGGDPHCAEEVTQMVFTALARKAAQLAHHPLLAGWLHQSTRWAAASQRRTEQRRRAHEQAFAAEADLTSAVTDATLDWDKLRPVIDAVLDELGEADRTALLLRFFANRSFAAIAAELGVGESAARMRVERALAKLPLSLARRGITSTTAALGVAIASQPVSAAPVGLAGHVATTASQSSVATSLAANLLMTKLQLAAAGTLALLLALGFMAEQRHLRPLESDLAAQRRQRDTLSTAVATLVTREAEQQEALRNLPPTPLVSPLTPEQQERQQLDLLIRKGELDQRYAPLFRHLHLDPVRLDAFKTLLVERNQAIYDATALAKKEGLVFASYAEACEVEASAVQAIDARIAGEISPAAETAVRKYRMSDFDSFGYLDKSLSLEARYELGERLTTLLATTCPTYLEDCFRTNGVYPYPDAFLAKAKEILTPAQAEELQRINNQELVFIGIEEINREAAARGELKLSKSSARNYLPAKSGDTPAKP